MKNIFIKCLIISFSLSVIFSFIIDLFLSQGIKYTMNENDLRKLDEMNYREGMIFQRSFTKPITGITYIKENLTNKCFWKNKFQIISIFFLSIFLGSMLVGFLERRKNRER